MSTPFDRADFVYGALAERIRTTRRRANALLKRVEHTSSPLDERIVEDAVRLMHSDFASLQMLFPERGIAGELRLLSFRGFNPEAAKFWEWVSAEGKSTCGFALLTGERAIAPEIATCEYMANSEDQRVYLETGIHACQTTPLITSRGEIVGMMSTHWRTPHVPSEIDLRLFDILAKQTANLIEHRRFLLA